MDFSPLQLYPTLGIGISRLGEVREDTIAEEEISFLIVRVDLTPLQQIPVLLHGWAEHEVT